MVPFQMFYVTLSSLLFSEIPSSLSFLSLNMISTIDGIIVPGGRAPQGCADWFLWSAAGPGPCYSAPCSLGIFDHVLVTALEIFVVVVES